MSQSQLTNFDQKLLDTAQIRVQPAQGVSYIIKLQFPPKVVSENNSMIWADKANTYSTGPVVWQKGATARKLEVEWEYIATDNVFTPDFIALQLRNLKSYHFDFKLPGSFLPVVVFKYTAILPDDIKFIIKNINISYSPEIIAFNEKYHPIHTKVVVSLQMVTQLGTIDGKQPPRQAFSLNLPKGPKPEWY
jgi:hypothetical protein